MTKASPKARAQSRARYAANREQEKERKRLFYHENKDVYQTRQVAWRAANPGYYRKWMFGLTPEDIEDMLQDQGGGCAICQATEPGGNKGWHVDHDHACCPSAKKKTCGTCIRGLLCSRCNKALGLMKDNPENLRTAALYLERQSK